MTDTASDQHGEPIPIGMELVFGCVRAVVFRDDATGFASIVGSGFFVKLFGEIFFITARHVIKHEHGFHIEDVAIQYQKTGKDCVPFCKFRTFSSRDADDTDHSDIIIYRVDPALVNLSLFGTEKPFDIVAKMFVTEYRERTKFYFFGLSTSIGDYDYENGVYKIKFSGGDVSYLRPEAGMLSVHVGLAEVNEQCPDFDGLSGSPLFSIDEPENESSPARFAGMLLRGTLSSKRFYFMDAASIYQKLLVFFVGGLSETEAQAKLTNLMCQFYTEVRYGYSAQPYVLVRFVADRILDVQISHDARTHVGMALPCLHSPTLAAFPPDSWTIDSVSPGDPVAVT